MLGPSWLIHAFIAVMLATAAYCAARIVVSQTSTRRTNYLVDAVHIAMGVAMAGMLSPGLRTFSAPVWEAIFLAATGGFLALALHDLNRRSDGSAGRHGWHALGSGAMVYMLAAMPAGKDMASMPGMTTNTMAGMSLRYPLAAAALGVLLLGYAWTTALHLLGLATVSVGSHSEPPVGRAAKQVACGAGGRFLAPRLAACCEVIMGLTMAYPLIALA